MPRKSLIGKLGYGDEDIYETNEYSVQGAGKYNPTPLPEKESKGEVLGQLVYNPQTKGLEIVDVGKNN
jgi:hypothetical protein